MMNELMSMRSRVGNALKNVPHVLAAADVAALYGSCSNRPILVFQSPLLNVLIAERARRHYPDAIAIATATTAAGLLKSGVEPDFIVATESMITPETANTLADSCPRTRLVVDGAAAPSWFAAFAERCFVFRAGGREPWRWLRSVDVSTARLGARPSAEMTALELARRLGGNPIVALGREARTIEHRLLEPRGQRRRECAPRVPPHPYDAHLLHVLAEPDISPQPPEAVTAMSPFASAPESERVARTASLARDGQTDLERWADERNLDPRWTPRSRRAARMIPPHTHVLDLGAGAQALRCLLPEGCRYTPSDVVARTRDTVVADLNRGGFPGGRYDVVTALGVLEYVHDIEPVLAAMRAAAPMAVLSYCAVTGGQAADRLKHGWVNAFPLEQLLRAAQRAGWAAAVGELLSTSAIFDQWIIVLRACGTTRC
jgi:hypothetical protein